MKGIKFTKINGQGKKIAIIKARWNSDFTESLKDGAFVTLLQNGVSESDIIIREVPGAFELPFEASKIISTEKPDAVVCLGVLIKGETMHFEYIAEAVAHGIMRLNLTTGTPVIFGVLACLNEAQAKSRSIGDNNHGISWALSALEMAK